MTDLIIAVIIIVILGLAITYVVKAKKSGAKCIGCPSAGNCSSHNKQSSCHCGCPSAENYEYNECGCNCNDNSNK